MSNPPRGRFGLFHAEVVVWFGRFSYDELDVRLLVLLNFVLLRELLCRICVHSYGGIRVPLFFELPPHGNVPDGTARCANLVTLDSSDISRGNVVMLCVFIRIS